MHLKASTPFQIASTSLQAFLLCFTDQKCKTVPGVPPSKFTTSEKPYIQYKTDYTMQMSTCINLQIIHYEKNVFELIA